MDLLINTYEHLRPGGIVMIPIILTSIWMWILIIERIGYLKKIDKDDIDMKDAVEMLQGRPFSESSGGLRIRIVRSFIEERTGKSHIDRSILEQCAMRERPELRRHLAVIAILAAVSPLFGLLGTVTGMITTFDVISIFGTGNARAMAGGISEAMITTQSGLLVAIPGLYMSAFLTRLSNRLERRLNEVVITLKRHV